MQMESFHLCKMGACCESLEKTYIFLTIITILGSSEGFQGNLATGAFMWSVCDYLLCQANGWMAGGVCGRGGYVSFHQSELGALFKSRGFFFFFLQSMSDCTNRLAAFVFRIGKTKAWEPG